jgi:hypothetical protein
LIFKRVREEGCALLDFIETRALRTAGVNEAIAEALDSTSYAISHELRWVFRSELSGLSSLEQAPLIQAKIEIAQGMLRNCFQQTTVALAQIFDPSYDGVRLFNDFRTRLEQSIILCKDLWRLIRLTERAEQQDCDQDSIDLLVAHLKEFRDGSMRYLLYKDWEEYERFVEEITTAHGTLEVARVLGKLSCYLNTLLAQVRMRAVLLNHPLDFSDADL